MISLPHSALLNHRPAARRKTASVYVVECPACGYEPDEQLILRHTRCPKCHRFAWRQRPRPGMLADEPADEPGAATVWDTPLEKERIP